MSSNFRHSCHKKRPNFLSQWEQSKVLTIYFFVFKCAHEESLWTKNNDLTGCPYENSLWQNVYDKWLNITFTIKSECLSTVLTLEWKSTSLNLNLIRLDHLTKKPWWQMHYGDFKSNLPWKHESIDKKLCFFWSIMKESP